MCPFRKKSKQKPPIAHPLYSEQPMGLLFQDYILDVIGHLPKERSDLLQRVNLQEVFNSSASEWREIIREVLHLSDTIDIAILDLWYINREIALKHGQEYDPVAFARDLVDHYYEDGSKVDVWLDVALEAAKERIAKYQSPKG